ncbi:hypothetical protein [Flavobacterium helocola]|uniref:Uncharacterized protein n=1 Tax=Flavobacterium helocola TaxID=3139139 RepID=A0ABU9I6I3_9FLAO
MNFFQKISYLQYPLMLFAMYFAIKPYTYIFEVGVNNQDKMFADLNSLLIFMGLGISFSTLQDTSKTQNKFSLKIWQNPKKGKRTIFFIAFFTFSILFLGLGLFLFSEKQQLKDLSFGIIALAIGLIGLLKASIEMFNNHRLDKNSNNTIETF